LATENSPSWVSQLEQVFGPASQAAFGSAVFYQADGDAGPAGLEAAARDVYRTFCGELWEEFGVENWLGTWRRLYERPAEQAGDIVHEIQALPAPETRSAALMLWEGGPDPTQAQAALRAAFDTSTVLHLHIYQIGDAGAMSGALLAAETAAGAHCFLIILLD